MVYQKVLEELYRESKLLEEAILSLERLAHCHGHRRGRPPGSKNRPRAEETGLVAEPPSPVTPPIQ